MAAAGPCSGQHGDTQASAFGPKASFPSASELPLGWLPGLRADILLCSHRSRWGISIPQGSRLVGRAELVEMGLP